MDELFALDFKFGAGLSLEFYLPRFNRIIFKGLYQLPDNFSLIQLSYDKQFYPEQDIGLPGHYYAPGWGLSMAAGLGDWLIGTPDDPDTFFFTKTSLDYNGLEKWGHSTRLSHTFHYYPNEPDAKAFENRLGFESLQALPFFPRTLLAFGLEGSMGLGQLKQLAASNAVLGWEETQGVLAARFPYALRFRLFLGLPLFNALEIGLSNSVVLQSLNIALVYEVASAFAAWEEFPGNLQQALGLEFLPYYRTIFDKGFGFGFGISFNLTNILNNAASGSSYRPGFFISLDPVSKLYSAVVAY
jgi:hypothetical protein